MSERRRADPEFLRARQYLDNPSLADNLETRFLDPTLAIWLTDHRATLVRPVPAARYWSVWRAQWFLGSGVTPHAAICRARRFLRSWRRSRLHPYCTPR